MWNHSRIVLAMLFMPLVLVVALPVAVTDSTEPWPMPGVYLVPLQKQDVVVKVRGRAVSHKTAYFGNISVGQPASQNFTVVFDTGSAHVFLPSSSCVAEPCLKHRRFDQSASTSAFAIDQTGARISDSSSERDHASLSYGTGEVSGAFVSEVLCVGSEMTEPTASHSSAVQLESQPLCTRLRLVCAEEMTAEPFNSFGFDGVLGLGLEALALHPEFNFFGQASRGGRMESIFSVFLASDADDRSEITLGGHNHPRMGGALTWVPVVAPEKGYWQINVRSVRVGNEDTGLCSEGCLAIVDTGTSMLGVPRSSSKSLHVKLAREVPLDSPPDVDCRAVDGPAMTFDLGDFSIELTAADYSRPAAMHVPSEGKAHVICRASLLPVEMPLLGPQVFILGEPVLRKYYTAYDTQRKRVAFTRAATHKDSPLVDGTIEHEPPRWLVV
jgi:hypothetical protein